MPDNWYEVVTPDAPLMQGDLVLRCPTLALPASLSEFEPGQLRAEQRFYNAVILTQSCDLGSKGVGAVLLCPYFPFNTWVQRTAQYEKNAAAGLSVKGHIEGEFKKLADGRLVAFHLLNSDEEAGLDDYQVVNLNAAFSVRRSIVEELVKRQSQRIRLNSPYREHLSQAFATLFMRVGLPQNITPLPDWNRYSPDEAFIVAAKARMEADKRAKEQGRVP